MLRKQEQYNEVYNNENVVIKVKKSRQYNRIFDRTEEIVTDVKILKDGKLYYEINEILLNYDCRGKISLLGRLNQLVMFIENKDITEFKTKDILYNFFKHCKVLELEIFYNRYQHEQQRRRKLAQF